MQRQKAGKKAGKYLIWILTGLVFAWMAAAMAVSGSLRLDQFYDSGEIYDINFDGRMAQGTGAVYDSAAGRYTLTEDTATLNYSLQGKFSDWNYLYIKVGKLNRETLEWRLQLFLKQGELVAEVPVTLKNGENFISLKGFSYNTLTAVMEHQKGAEFSIARMQFRERENVFTAKKFLIFYLGAFLLFLFAGGGLRRLLAGKIKIDFYAPVEFLQDMWIMAAQGCLKPFYTLKDRTRSILRSSLVCLFILFMAYMENVYYPQSKPYYGICMTISCLCMLCLSCFSLEQRLKRVDWKNPLTTAWFCLWILACISDLAVDKKYQFQGYIMIFFMSFLFFVWNNMKRPSDFLRDLARGMEMSFVVTTVFSFLCRPEIADYRYLGIFRNPNIEAAYTVAAAVIFLVELDQRIQKKKSGIPAVLYCTGLLIASDLTWRTESRTGQLAILLVGLVVFLKNIYTAKHYKTWKQFAAVVIACMILYLPVLSADNWMLNHLPERLGTQVIYKRDAYCLSSNTQGLFTDMIYAGEAQQEEAPKAQAPSQLTIRKLSDLFQEGSLEAYSSGRTLYYLAYIRQMNLLGHYYHARNWGDYIYPHNALLEIMYRYGVFAGIPYLCMLCLYLWYAFRYLKRNVHTPAYAMFPLAVAVGAYSVFALENGEKPFLWAIWILYYFGMGILFPSMNGEVEEHE